MTTPSPRRPSHHRESTLLRRLKALLALGILLALTGVIPLGLIVFYGNPIPDSIPTGADVAELFTSSDTLGFLLFVLVWIGWIAWATFTLSVVIELIARARSLPAPQLRGLGMQQGLAALLITMVAGLSIPAAPVASVEPATLAPALVNAAPTTPDIPAEQPGEQEGHEDEAAEEKAEDLVVTVQRGDSVWGLAEQHLGSGQDWRLIVEANSDRIQDDGGRLTYESADYLEEGWQLTIPGVPAPTPSDEPISVTVQEGQTLSSIAQDELGDEDRWPEIYEASTSITQPGGTHLEDPDQIDVGWTLNVPGTEASTTAESPAEEPTDQTPENTQGTEDTSEDTEEAEEGTAGAEETKEIEEGAAAAGDAPTQAPQEATPSPTAESPATEAPGQSPAGQAPAAEDTSAEVDEETASVPWAGVGSILAASMLAALLAKRLHTRRKRRADQRIPAAATIDIDQVRLTRIEDPTVLGFVDRALRTLAALQLRDDQPLPDVRLARLTTTHLELYAATTTTLPTPFEATTDPATWLLPRTAALADDETLADILAPYPALVTIGTDHDGHQILVDLEHLAALGIHAAGQTSMPVMRALTVSLATSQWADDLSITTVGVCPELEDALGSGRIAYRDTLAELLDHFEAKLHHDQELLADLGHDSAQHARQATGATDLWAPEIIVVGTEISLSEKQRLQRVVDAQPQIAVAVISSDQHTDLSEWRLHIASLESARLEPLGLDVHPQHLTDHDYAAVLRALDASTALEPSPDEYDAAGTEAADDPRQPIIHPAARGILTATQRDTAPEIPTGQPYLRLLGPIEVLGATGPLEKKRSAAATEAATYIYLNPHRADADFRADLWPGRRVSDSTRHELISRTRRWLGEASDGTAYLMRATGEGTYSLSEHITSDWATLEKATRDLASTSTQDLADALKLVTGTPMDAPSPTRYRWSFAIQNTMIDAVLDLAHELAERALDASDTDTALWATQHGLLAEPLSEQLWRDRLRAAAHDPDLHHKLSRDLTTLASTDTDEGYDLLPDTIALLASSSDHDRAAS